MKFLWWIWLLPFYSPAQDYQLNTRYPGYFINAKGDTIRGYILLTNKLENQRGAEYSNDARGEKIVIKLLPYEVKGYKVKDRIYTSLIYGDHDPLAEHFLMTHAEGRLRLYQYFWLSKDLYIGMASGQRPATGDDEQYLQSEYIVVDESGKQYVIPGQAALNRHAGDLFSGDGALLEKIRNKEKGYRYGDLPDIVSKYNASEKRK